MQRVAKAKEKPPIDFSGTEGYDYDQWLEFFRKVGPHKTITHIDWIEEHIEDSYGYAAARRWLEIFQEPSRMEKLYKARLDKKNEEDIMDIAVGDDDEKFYESLIRQNVSQLNSSSTSPQEVARLTQNINIFRKSLHEIRSRRVKKGSVLEKVLIAAEKGHKKPNVKKTTPVKKKTTSPKAVEAKKSVKTDTKSLKTNKRKV